MTSQIHPAIAALGKKAERFFLTYRAISLQAVEEAAARNGDTLDATITQSHAHVASSWRSRRFGQREARAAFYKLSAMFVAAVLVLLNGWGMWLAWAHFGFDTVIGGIAALVSMASLGLFSMALISGIIAGIMHVPCELCLAVSLWTRGWTPVSMEWFGDSAGATWGLGSKNIYIWQKPFHGWGNPELRVIRYQDIQIMPSPADSHEFLCLCLDYQLPQPRTEWLLHPQATNGMSAEQLATEIRERAAQAGRSVQLLPSRTKDSPEKNHTEHTLIQIIPPKSCWKLLF